MPRPPLASSYDFARTAGCYTGDGDQPPITDEDRGRFVVVTIGLHVEATAVSALHAAVAALDGPPADALDEQLRNIPADIIGRLFGHAFRPTQLFGVIVHSGWSTSEVDRDGPPNRYEPGGLTAESRRRATHDAFGCQQSARDSSRSITSACCPRCQPRRQAVPTWPRSITRAKAGV